MIQNNMNNKKMIFLVIFVLITLILIAKPVITFNQLTHDFGVINEEDGTVTHKFTFTNSGDEPLKLIKVKAS